MGNIMGMLTGAALFALGRAAKKEASKICQGYEEKV